MTSSIFWPGTGIPRSTWNAFDWRGRPSSLAEADPTYFRPKKQAKQPATGFAENGGKIKGLSAEADRRLLDIEPRPLVHVSRAMKGGA